MGNTKEATYRTAELPEYEGHPLITALPPIVTDAEAHGLYATDWSSSTEERGAPSNLRRLMVKRLKQFLFSLPEYIDIFRAIEEAMTTGYLPKNPTTPTGQHYLHFLDPNATSTNPITGAFCSTGSALSIFGESGAGKSRGVQRTLETYPQVIEHSEFNGRPLPIQQVTWLSVECPPSASVRGFANAILDQLSKALGPEQFETLPRPRNIHDATVQIQRRLRSLWLGVLVLEELQNLSVGKEDLRAQFLNMVLTIINEAGVPVLFVGNDETQLLLQDTLRNARRAEDAGQINMGPIDPRVWPLFLQKLWPMQYTKTVTPLDEALEQKMYTLSKGLPAFAVKLYMKAQECVIGSDDERITPGVLDEAYFGAFGLSANQLERVSLPDVSPVRPQDSDKKTGAQEQEEAMQADNHGNPPISDVDRAQHPEFGNAIANTRNNGFRIPLGIDSEVLQSAMDHEDAYEFLISNEQMLVGLNEPGALTLELTKHYVR